jgi:hypothetical protein
MVEILDFLMGYESYLDKRRNIVKYRHCYISVVSLSRLFACKVVEVFNFHLHIYFQGHTMRNPHSNILNILSSIANIFYRLSCKKMMVDF